MAESLDRGPRAKSFEDILPLIEFCKLGKLFEVQAWIAAGKPVNPPEQSRGRRRKPPLEIAVEHGFHSLVKVLFEAGAIDDGDGYRSLIYFAMQRRRRDLVELFVENGFDAATVDMAAVFDSWDPGLMEYFIQRGASLEKHLPFANAFCSKIRTAFGPYKKYRETIPALQEQANIALRYHCKAGDVKWISMMLWAGADPLAPGADEPRDLYPDEEGTSALCYAALYKHFEIFEMKRVKIDPQHPESVKLIRYLGTGDGIEVLQTLLARGLNPNDTEFGGCSAIQSHLQTMSWDFSWRYSFERKGGKIDTEHARDCMKAIHVLAKHGAKWKPQETSGINGARRSLLQLIPDYAVEFLWIMSLYEACTLEVAERLRNTPTMKRHLERSDRAREIMQRWRAQSERTIVG